VYCYFLIKETSGKWNKGLFQEGRNLKRMSILPTRFQALNLSSDDKENFKHGGKSKILGEHERNTPTITTKSEV